MQLYILTDRDNDPSRPYTWQIENDNGELEVAAHRRYRTKTGAETAGAKALGKLDPNVAMCNLLGVGLIALLGLSLFDCGCD